jgi:hypothetical protein
MINFRADRLRQMLKTRGIKACVFAANSELTPSTVSTILRGHLRVGPKTLEKIKNGLLKSGIPLSEAMPSLLPNNNNPHNTSKSEK